MKADILLVVVNDHEEKQLKAELDTHEHKGSDVQNSDSLYHYVDYGTINGQRVILSCSRMSSSAPGASYDTVRTAIQDYEPSLVICIGIGWGGDENTQKLGDLLISSQIQIGANKKVGDQEVQYRSERPGTSITAQRTLEESAKQLQIDHHTGILISEETLFDNKESRDRSLSSCSAIGGEMEAMGVIMALDRASKELNQRFDMVVAKSICDWGYKKNIDSVKKERDQIAAALNSAKVVVNALNKFKLVSSASNKHDSLKHKKTKNHSIDETLNSILNCTSGLDFEVLRKDTDKFPTGATVYWPVRLRKPNIVHAAQTYVATYLQARGLVVKLCIDDLGNVEGYPTAKSGVEDFKERISAWASKVGNPEYAKSITDNTLLFSKYIKEPDDEQNADVYAMLGKNLVRWLMASERLKNVLEDSKLLDHQENPLLNNKPRKLLSPSVVWTVMECIVGEDEKSVVTLGGHDEFSIWDTCPQRDRFRIQSVFLPRVRGDMDADSLRPETLQRLESILETRSETREWVLNYLAKFPAQVKGSRLNTPTNWENISTRELAEAVFAYY